MSGPVAVGPGIFLVAGPGLSDDRDAAAYLVEDGGESALIDAGAGPGYSRILANIRSAGTNPENLSLIIATHAHIDHIGGLSGFVRDFGVTVAAHEQDAAAIETADPERTAASWYGLKLDPVEVTVKLSGPVNVLVLGQNQLTCLHTPGHTPGSISVCLDKEGQRYLFGQDIHGPFHPSFGSDINAWRKSMHKLLALEADILCEGHYGVIRGKKEVAGFIEDFLRQNLP